MFLKSEYRIEVVVFHLWILAMLLLLPGVLTCQYDMDKPSLHFTADDGLPNHYFRGIIKDKAGFYVVGNVRRSGQV